jgi:parallel beta-helix repeat protein
MIAMKNYIFKCLHLIVAPYLILITLYVPVHGQNNDFFNFEDGLGSGWINYGEINWNIDPIQRDNSNFSLKSGEIICASQNSCISREVQGPAEISFWWSKSVYLYFLTDFSFSVDGITQSVCNEPSIWRKKHYSISDNKKHKIQWTFKLKSYGNKDKIINCYPNARASGWIDDVSIKYSLVHESPVLMNMSKSNDTILVKPTDNLNEIIKCSKGKIIVLGSGIYSNFTIKSINNITITCQEKESALLDSNGNIGISIENASNITISGLNIFNSSCGIRLFNATGCEITENKIDFSNNSGIYIENSYNNSINLNDLICTMEGDFNTGIRLINSNHNIVIDNYIHEFSSHDPYASGYMYLLENSYNNTIYNREYGIILDNDVECQLHASRPEDNNFKGLNTVL